MMISKKKQSSSKGKIDADVSKTKAQLIDELQKERRRTSRLKNKYERLIQADQELFESNEILENVFSTSTFSIAYLDKDFNFIRVNKRYAELDNRSPDFFLGKNHFALYPNKENEAIFRKVIETGEPHMATAKPFEYPEAPERGMTHWDWSLFPVKDQDGTVGAVILFLVDVTEHVRAERALEEQRNLFRTMLNSTSDLIFLKDRTSVFLSANPAFLKYVQMEEKDLVGKSTTEVFPGPDGKQYYLDDQAVMDKGVQLVQDEKSSIPGDETWYQVVKNPVLNEDGNATGIICILRDITERKKIQDNLTQAQVELKNELLISKAVGELSAALLKESSLEEMANLTLSSARALTSSEHGYASVIDPVTMENIGYTLTRMMGDACKINSKDMRIRFPIGENGKYPLLWGCSLNKKTPMYTNSPSAHPASKGIPSGHIPLKNFLAAPAIFAGELVGQIALANSDREYTERDLETVARLSSIYAIAINRARAENELIKTIAEKEMLMRESYHRIKNNLAVIESLLKLQYRDIKDEKAKEKFQESEDRVRSMSLIHEQLYRSEDMTRLNLPQYLKSLVSKLSLSYRDEKSRVGINFDIPDMDVEADAIIPLGLIVNELVTNSFKYAFPEGAGKISISIEEAGDDITLRVRDNGIGIPEGLDVYKVTSLGMQIVTSLTSQLNGKLKVERRDGTEVTLKIKKARLKGE